MSKGLQQTGKFIKAVIDGQISIFGEVPINYVAAVLETIRREAFTDPTLAEEGVPPRWRIEPPTKNLRHQMRKDVKRVVVNHSDYVYRYTEEFVFIRYAGSDIGIITRNWKEKINKELAKHGAAY